MKELIRVIVVDDEPPARDSIAILLAADPSFLLVEQCSNGKTAIDSIILHKPELVFLDIQMPGINGFEVIEAVKKIHFPYIIFVTAFDKYAIRAFDHNALDYLLKPYDDERFFTSLGKAKKAIEANKAKSYLDKMEGLLEVLKTNIAEPKTPASFVAKLSVKQNGRTTFIPVEEIDYIESEGSFVKIFSNNEYKIAGYTFIQLYELLNPDQFIRIHKSFLVNAERIEAVEPHFHGDYFIYLKNGNKLKLSRNYKEGLSRILKF